MRSLQSSTGLAVAMFHFRYPAGYRQHCRACSIPADVLHFLFDFDAEASAHALLELLDERVEIGRRSSARVVDQVGVIGGHVDIAALQAFGAGLFEEPRSRNLALAYRRRGYLLGHPLWKFVEEQILEDAAGALHGDGEFLAADSHDLVRGLT